MLAHMLALVHLPPQRKHYGLATVCRERLPRVKDEMERYKASACLQPYTHVYSCTDVCTTTYNLAGVACNWSQSI